MHFKSLIIIFLLLFSLICPVFAGDFEEIFGENSTIENSTITLYPSGTDQDQDYINKALEKYDTVYLSSGTYITTDSIYVDSGTCLTGDSDAVIQVSSTSSQWFTGMKGIICSRGRVDNVVIEGFQIDGNCDELPASYANSRADTAHDCERAIIIKGSTNNFCENITIANMEIVDCFSDGPHVRFAKNVHIYNNFVSNCQHSAIYLVSVIGSLVEDNEVAGITSDNLRYDNCVEFVYRDNYFYSYTGDHNNGAWKGHQNGVQIADAGASHGYNASNKPTTTKNGEGYNNTFVNIDRNVWLDSTGKGIENVYLHDNNYLSGDVVETAGVPVQGISFVNMPSKELSKQVFETIYSILGIENTEFVDSGITNQTADDIDYEVTDTENGKVAGGVKIIGWGNKIIYKGVEYVSSPDDALIKSSVVKNPSLDAWSGGIADKHIDFNTTVKNGIATVKMTVTTFWYNLKTNKLTGKHEKSKLKTSVYTFNDSGPAPNIWPEFNNTTGFADEYRGKIKDYTLVYGPSKGLQKIVFRYNGTVTTHYFMIGQRYTDPEGIQYTTFEDVNYWDGDLDHLGDALYINGTFEPDKLQVEAYSPYKSETLDIQHSIYEQKEDAIEGGLFETIIKALVFLFGIDRLIRILKN